MSRPPSRPRAPKPFPWVLAAAKLTNPEIHAIRAFAEGRAGEYEQRLAWTAIREKLCGAEIMSFWPGGEDGRRASDFAEGKRWVAIELRRISRLTPSGVDIRDEPPPMPSETKVTNG